MILRVRLEAITIDFGGEQFAIPSMPDKIVHLPDEPVAPDTSFRGKQLIMNYPREPFIIKWGFQRAVGSLQHQLLDDPTLDSAAEWNDVDSSGTSSIDKVEAFFRARNYP
jgi:hypothetical protein